LITGAGSDMLKEGARSFLFLVVEVSQSGRIMVQVVPGEEVRMLVGGREQMCRFYVSRANSNPCGGELLPFLLLHCTPRYINFNSSYSTSTGSLKASAYSGGPMGRRIQFLHSQGALSQPGAGSTPAPHPRPLEAFSSRERHTWGPPRHHTS
jgi:hypothetical protein